MAMVRAKFRNAVHGNRLNFVWAAPKLLAALPKRAPRLANSMRKPKGKAASPLYFLSSMKRIQYKT